MSRRWSRWPQISSSGQVQPECTTHTTTPRLRLSHTASHNTETRPPFHRRAPFSQASFSDLMRRTYGCGYDLIRNPLAICKHVKERETNQTKTILGRHGQTAFQRIDLRCGWSSVQTKAYFCHTIIRKRKFISQCKQFKIEI